MDIEHRGAGLSANPTWRLGQREANTNVKEQLYHGKGSIDNEADRAVGGRFGRSYLDLF